MTDLFDNNTSGAKFSDCKKYRYALWRIWDMEKAFVMFIGLNPSTASESENDPTIRRVIRFAKDWGFGGVYMMNCFPFVTSYPKQLEINGNNELNDQCISDIGSYAGEIIFAWGDFKIARGRAKELVAKFPNAKALIINSNGTPRHPLYVKADVKPVLFKREIATTLNDENCNAVAKEFITDLSLK